MYVVVINSLDIHDIDAYYSSQDDGEAGVWNCWCSVFRVVYISKVYKVEHWVRKESRIKSSITW